MKKHNAKTTRMKQTFPIRVALFPEKADRFSGWVAQCLDFSLVAQGTTAEEAQENFQRTLRGHIALALHRGIDPFIPCTTAVPVVAHAAKKAPTVDMGKLRVCYSRLGTPHTVSAMK